MSAHQAQWNQISQAWLQGRIPQGLLFVGPLHCDLDEFTSRVIQLLLCAKKGAEACRACKDCHMVDCLEHPDMEWIRPEKKGGSIKIDAIRELQNSAYLTPKRAAFRVVVIDAADRMNTASSNALLKILEEPAPHTVFILVAQQLGTLLPTLLSRCQIIRFTASDERYAQNLLDLGAHYPQDSDRALIINDSEQLIEALIAVIEGKQHPCGLAASWAQYEFNTLLWFLYLVFAQIQRMQFVSFGAIGKAEVPLRKLASLLNPVILCMHIDILHSLIKKLSQNRHVNSTLALEELLLALAGEAL
ncbi:MAG: DNA polymerase III subunit delta' [Legionellales bacterium]